MRTVSHALHLQLKIWSSLYDYQFFCVKIISSPRGIDSIEPKLIPLEDVDPAPRQDVGYE